MQKYLPYFIIVGLVISVIVFGVAVNQQLQGKIKVNAQGADLTIVDAQFSPSEPLVGDKIDLAVRVKNIGIGNAPAFAVSAKDQTAWGGASAAVKLAPGSSTVVHIKLVAAERNAQQLLSNNPHKFNIVVDPKNVIKEKDESNNTYQKDLVVYSTTGNFAPGYPELADYVEYNNDKRIVLEWSDTSTDVEYEVRYHSLELVNNNVLDPSTVWGMSYYTQATASGVVYYVSQDNVSQEYKDAVSTWQTAPFYFYTHESGYNASTFFVADNMVTEFAVIAKKQGQEQLGRAVRLYYITPYLLQVHDLKPSEHSSQTGGVALNWTNQSGGDNGYILKSNTSSDINQYQLVYYTATTQAGMTYYVAEPSKYLYSDLQNFTVEGNFYGQTYYSAPVSLDSASVYTYIVESRNSNTGQMQISNVVVIDNRYPDQQGEEVLTTRAELSKVVASEAAYPLVECTEAVYADVLPGSWFCPYVKALKDAGVYGGDSSEYFYPEVTVSRSESSKVIIQGFRFEGGISDGAPHFVDVMPEDWFYVFVESLYIYAGGASIGFEDGTFRPGGETTDQWLAETVQKVPHPTNQEVQIQ